MKAATKVWMGVNAFLVGGWAVLTVNHVEAKQSEWAAELRARRVCEAPGLIPADIRCLIVKTTKHNPPALIAAVAYQESRFKPDVCSKAQACGLMQFVPGTAKAYRVDPFDAQSSIAGADAYLRDLRATFGNHGLALAAYNWGPTNLQAWLRKPRRHGIPKETRDYVQRITGHPIQAWVAKRPKVTLAGHVSRMAKEF